MADRGKSIIREDCPQGKAPVYPGKKNKNNPNGSELSKNEFVGQVIEGWVRHFGDKEKYRNTSWSNKNLYLHQYLIPLGLARSAAKKLLIDVETKLAGEVEQNELTNSQNVLGGDMEIGQDKDIVRSRWGKDQEVKQVLELSDQQLFEEGTEVPENVKYSDRYKRREKSYYLSLSDKDLIEKYNNISSYTLNSKEFKTRHNQIVEKYMDDNFAQASSQEILLKIPDTPACIQNSGAYKERLCHLSFAERSERLVMQNIKDTMNELEKTKEGRKQAKIIAAGVSHPVFGDPGLNLNWRIKEKARKAKENLLTGMASTLKMPEKKKRNVFPESVEAVAADYWMENTIPEPAKHTGKALEEGGETIPTRYQDKTDRECYLNFKEECQGKIKIAMQKVADEMKTSLSTRPDTADKRRRVEYAESLPDKFPSQDWFIDQRPKETKPLCSHTTGLCHLCEGAKQNFANIVNTVKRCCSCGSHSCPNFTCACPLAEDDDEETPCECPPCECSVCMTCQVS